MIVSLAESASLLAGAGWAGSGAETIFDSVIRYLSSAWPMWCLAILAFFLGALFFGRRRNSPLKQAPEPAKAAAEEQPDVAEASHDDSEAKQLIAELKEELSASQKTSDQRLEELAALQGGLDAAQQQLSEQQERFVRLSDSLKEAATHSGGQASLANARAPVIYLNEVVRSERQHLDTCLDRLQHLEDRLTEDNLHVWHCADKVAAVHGEIAGTPAAEDPKVGEIAGHIGGADDQLRVIHQNVQGCLQRIAGSKSRLESEAAKLAEAAGPISNAEAALAKLAATEDRADNEAIETAFAEASTLLSESCPVIESLENGIEQEIAETTDRIDWVVKDSPKNFFKALDQLSECEPAADPLIEEQVAEVWELLTEAKGTLVGIELALDAVVPGGSEHGCGKHLLVEALDRAVQTLESAAIAPAIPDETEKTETRVAELEEELALSEERTARLAREFQSQAEEMIQLQEELEALRAVEEGVALRAEEEGESGNFVRRLLGLGPGEESAGIRRAPAMSATGAATMAVTLAEAQEILGELKLASTNGSGNGGHRSEDPAADEDLSPVNPEITKLTAELEEKDAELTHLRKTTTAQQARIEKLEKKIAELRETIPLNFTPAPTIIPADQPDTPSQVPLPGLIGGITPGDQIYAGEDERVIFRGDDLSTWDSDYEGPNDRLAIPLERLPADVHYLRMRRLDTGDSVVIPITRQELLNGSSTCGLGCGWSGKRERYFGGDHIGIYDQSLPREVETKFGAGGWGFGHIENISSRQAHGWAGRKIDPTDFEISVGTGPGSAPAEEGEPADSAGMRQSKFPEPGAGIIIFRSNHPDIWDLNTYAGANSRSRKIADLPEEVAWLRIRQLPGGESVILPMTREGLSGNGEGQARGFNGSNESFYGARHLGAFDEALPQEVETRFTYGGWGFGHRPLGEEEQASSWAGREIDSDTVFEFIVYGEMPEVDGLLDRVLEPR